MECCREIRGVINTVRVIRGGVSMQGSLSGTVGTAIQLGGVLNYNQGYSPTVYDGAYTVTPILHEAQTLNTKNKLLEDDISVLEIPVTRTTNPQGGLTVLIG